MTLSGVYLWWPVRSNFNFFSVINFKSSSKNLPSHHKNLGVFIAIGLILIILTGLTMLVQKLSRTLLPNIPVKNTYKQVDSKKSAPSQLLLIATNAIPKSFPSYIWLSN